MPRIEASIKTLCSYIANKNPKPLRSRELSFKIEQGLFPLVRVDDDPDQIEEERRLFYVAVTRAMERVYLLNAKYRRKFGTTVGPTASIKKQLGSTQVSKYAKDGGYVVKKKKKVVKKRKK